MNNHKYLQEMNTEEYRLQDMSDRISELEKDIENMKSGNTFIWLFIWLIIISLFML